MASYRFLFSNGVVLNSPDAPSVSTFLESQPGAYTTTRTHNRGSSLLFWERHVKRLANSVRILFNSNPQLLLFNSGKSTSLISPRPPPPPISPQVWESAIRTLVGDSMRKALPIALRERRDGEELAITALVSGELERWSEMGESPLNNGLDVHLHIGSCVPPSFGIGASLAVVGPGRDFAQAKYSAWVRLRKPLEMFRPSASATELLLSNDGDHLLEGCVTNFFVVCRKDNNEVEEKYIRGYKSLSSFEVQTAPVSDGVLPGVIRQLVIEVCLRKGIPLREVAPSWSSNDCWKEAFITNSLRIIQHVEKIQFPCPWKSFELTPPEEILWEERQFEEDSGMITAIIQREILEMASLEAYPV